jgi:hypothetical protein
MKYFDHIHISLSSPFTLPSPPGSHPQTTLLFYVHVIFLGVDSTAKKEHLLLPSSTQTLWWVSLPEP